MMYFTFVLTAFIVLVAMPFCTGFRAASLVLPTTITRHSLPVVPPRKVFCHYIPLFAQNSPFGREDREISAITTVANFRRSIVSVAAASLTLSAALLGSYTQLENMNILPPPTFAAVGEGDLPGGVIAFSKILKYQSDWATLAQTIGDRRSELSDQEVLGIKAFLKQLANEYGDMKLLSRGIVDTDKAEHALSIAREFRQTIRKCDDAASDRDFDKILELYPRSAQMLVDYLEALQDVPDEL